MPEIGEVKKGTEIGLKTDQKRIWMTCVNCKKPRWTVLSKSIAELCHYCNSVKQGKSRRKALAIPLPSDYIPQIGDIRSGPQLGYSGSGRKFIWLPCRLCDKPRWVQLNKNGEPLFWRCQNCASKAPEVRAKQHLSHLRECSTWWKGGIIHTLDGYTHIYLSIGDPFYPMAHRRGYVAEHRLVMAKHLGRCLKSSEVVHHKNGNRSDNRLKNLYLTTVREHQGITALGNRLAAAEKRITVLEAENTLLLDQLSAWRVVKEKKGL